MLLGSGPGHQPSSASPCACSRSPSGVSPRYRGEPGAITIAGLEDGVFVEVNPAAERLGGYTRAEK